MSNPSTLEELQVKFKADIDLSAGNPASVDLYTRLYDLTGHVLRISNLFKSDEQPIPDLVTNLRAEIVDLKARLGASSQNDKIIEDTRTALRQREEAPPGQQTAATLPQWASIMYARATTIGAPKP